MCLGKKQGTVSLPVPAAVPAAKNRCRIMG